MNKNSQNPLDARLQKHPFISSVILMAFCNISLYILYLTFPFAIMPLTEKAGIPIDGSGVPLGRIISVIIMCAAVLFADVFYAIKAESRLGFPIWFIGIPINFILFSVIPHNDFFDGFNMRDICLLYFYRLLPFTLVRSYSYLAKDEKRKKALSDKPPETDTNEMSNQPK